MKTTHQAALILALASTPLLAAPGSGGADNGNANQAIPAVPMALFSCNPSVVQTGTYPTLTWAITYPSTVGDVATISAPGTITLTQPMFVSVRPVGVGVTQSGRGQDIDTINAEARISVGGSAYDQLFYGTNADVDPAYSLYIKKLTSGTSVDFGGRFVTGTEWSPFYTSKSSNMQVVALVNGDSIPTSFDLAQSGKLASYLKPYVNGAGKVNIGPLSVLVLMELAERDNSNQAFDYQDMALLVTFAKTHPNNGHGNNLDGVDSSNPGKGSGGPNGEVDPSGGVDDEAR